MNIKKLYQVQSVYTNGSYEDWALEAEFETLKEAKEEYLYQCKKQQNEKHLICTKGCYIALVVQDYDLDEKEELGFEILETTTIK